MSELKTNLQSILQEKTTKIIPQNIKKDVEVLGVTGSYDKEDIKELQDELADAEQELADVRRDLDNSTATISGSGENVTLDGTANARFKKAPLPLGNSTQEVIEAQAGTTASGESILASGIDLNKVEILNINGNTKQETTTGKNLYDDNFDDYSRPYEYHLYPVALEQGETYTLSATLIGTEVTGVVVAIAPSGEKYEDFSSTMKMCLGTNGVTSTKTFTVDNTWTSPKIVVYLGYSNPRQLFNDVFENYEIQLEKSSTKTDYEPYTGGKASPNPDYPQEAYSAGANMNLFDKNNVISNAYLDSNGNEAFDGVWNITDYIPIISNKVYSYNGITTPGVAPYSAYYDSNKNFISSFKQAIGKNSIIVPSNAAYVRFSLAARNTDPIFNDLDTFKFEKGNETTAYSAYNQGSMSLEISNKNLFDKNNFNYVNEKRLDDNGNVITDKDSSYSTTLIRTKPSTTYTIQGTQGVTGKTTRVYFYDKNKTFIERGISYDTDSYSFTTLSDCYYIALQLRNSTYIDLDIIQLEEGSTATTYVAHEGQSFTIPTQAPFRKIGDYKDTFVKKVDGKWYEKHIIREIIFDGTEYWSVSNNVFYLTSISDYANSSGKICLSNKYTTIDNTNAGTSVISQNNSICFFNTNTNPRLYIRDERFSTVADFTAWLAQQYANGIPVYANYILAVPIYIECTQEQSDILDQINTFYETTNIFSADEVSPNFTFTYNKVYASPSPDDASEIHNVTGDVEVLVQNKNLFDVESFNTVLYEMTITRANNKITLNGTATHVGAINFYDNYTANYVEYISNPTTTRLKAGTYTISLNNINGTQNDIYCNLLVCKKKSTTPNTLLAYFSLKNQVSTSFTLDAESDIYLGIQWSADKSFTNFSFNIQLEKSAIATTYTPHQDQTFTFPLSQGQKLMLGDYLADDGIHHVRGQKKYMGTEGWWEYSSLALDNTRVFALTNNIAPKNSNCLSNYFNTSITGWGNLTQIDKEILQIYSDKQVYIRISKDRANNLTDFKTWLSTHNTTVEYELEEVIVPYTSTQQLVYNSIKKAFSYDEQTNVSGISSGASPRFDIIALRNMNAILNTLENEIELLP